jgi:hypothetical protein
MFDMLVTCQNGLSLLLMFKIWSVSRLVNGRPTIGYNVLALGAVADFGAQNCQYTTKVDAR